MDGKVDGEGRGRREGGREERGKEGRRREGGKEKRGRCFPAPSPVPALISVFMAQSAALPLDKGGDSGGVRSLEPRFPSFQAEDIKPRASRP